MVALKDLAFVCNYRLKWRTRKVPHIPKSVAIFSFWKFSVAENFLNHSLQSFEFLLSEDYKKNFCIKDA